MVEVVYYDVDAKRRAAVRLAVKLDAVVARNQFSDDDARAVFERELALAMLSDADRKAKSSWVAFSLVPEPYRNNAANHPSMCREPYGVAVDLATGYLLYADKSLGELRKCRYMDLPSPNTRVVGGLKEPTGVCICGDFAYVAVGFATKSRRGPSRRGPSSGILFRAANKRRCRPWPHLD